LILTGQSAWRAYLRAARRLDELSGYATEQADELERITAALNEHGFQLEHTIAELAPRLEQMAAFLRQPLVAASIPWILRRAFRRPFRRR
jgi:hypothetical protein